MVSLRSYRNQLSLALCNYKTKMNFQKTALFVFSKCLVLGARHVWWRGFRGFVLIAIGKMEILATFPHLQDDIKVIRRYEGWYYTHLVHYYTLF